MMKKMCKALLILFVLICLLPALSQAEAVGTLQEDVRVRTGPGEGYTLLPGLTLEAGEVVSVRTQYRSNGMTWLQVVFSRGGQQARGYVLADDVNVSLRGVPVEAPLCGGVMTADAIPHAAPDGLTWDDTVYEDVSVIVYEAEDGWLHVEFWCRKQMMKARAWVPLTVVKAEMALSFDGYYGVAEAESLLVPSPTRAPSTYYGATQGYPVGKMCTVVAGSCHIKEQAGEDWPTVAYGYVGERYKVLDCCTGSTGKDWYLVKKDGVYGWISSGLVSLDR